MAAFETLHYTVENRVALITQNRPQVRNAFNAQLRRELVVAIERASADEEVRVLVLAGAGNGFGAGQDLSEDLGAYSCIADLIETEYKPIMLAIHEAPKLVLAAVQGAAAGMSGAMVMACDLVVMAESAFIYQAFLPIGVIPDGGTSWHLVNTLGYKRALQMIVDAEKMPARRCVELGLANRVVAEDQLLPETLAWAQRLAAGPPLAQRYAKQVLRESMLMDLEATIDAEARLQNICNTSEDSIAAVQAFLDKRQPEFRGR